MKKQAIGILVNDIHLDKDNGELVKNIFNQLISLCKEYNTKRIFCGGDVFTNRSGQPLQCLTDWKDILQLLTNENIELHIIPGNHDKTDSDDEKSYLDVYSEPCVNLYRSGVSKFIDGCVVTFIPYFKDEKWLEEYQKIFSQIKEYFVEHDTDCSWPMILITHSGFDGVVNNDGTKVSSIIKPSMFENWTNVLIGHYHNASKLADNVIYTGSAYQNNYGENITDKGFTVVFNDGSIKFVPSKFPKYIKEVIDANDKETLMNLLEKYEGEEFDHIRFIFKGKKTDCQKINIAEIQGKYGIDCKFELTETTEAIEISESDSVLSYNKEAIIKDFLKFCSENNIKKSKFKYGFDLIKKMKNVESN
jgi:DNA repair exonuclease SbcCD nuclease subunit